MRYVPDNSLFGDAYEDFLTTGVSGLEDLSLEYLQELYNGAQTLTYNRMYSDDPDLREFFNQIGARIGWIRGAQEVDPTYDPNLRELDHRCEDGIDVTLFWDPTTNSTYVRVEDTRMGTPPVLNECPSDRARDCFMHPFAMLV